MFHNAVFCESIEDNLAVIDHFDRMFAEVYATGADGRGGFVLGVRQPDNVPVRVLFPNGVANGPGTVSASFSTEVAEDNFILSNRVNSKCVEQKGLEPVLFS